MAKKVYFPKCSLKIWSASGHAVHTYNEHDMYLGYTWSIPAVCLRSMFSDPTFGEACFFFFFYHSLDGHFYPLLMFLPWSVLTTLLTAVMSMFCYIVADCIWIPHALKALLNCSVKLLLFHWMTCCCTPEFSSWCGRACSLGTHTYPFFPNMLGPDKKNRNEVNLM